MGPPSDRADRQQALALLCIATIGAPGVAWLAAVFQPSAATRWGWLLLTALVAATAGALSMAFSAARSRGLQMPRLDPIFRPTGMVASIAFAMLVLPAIARAPWRLELWKTGPIQVLGAVFLAALGQLAASYFGARRGQLRTASVGATLLLNAVVFHTFARGAPWASLWLRRQSLAELSNTPNTLAALLLAWVSACICWFAWRTPVPTQGSFTHTPGLTEHTFTFSGAGPLARQRFFRRVAIALPVALTGLVAMGVAPIRTHAAALFVVGLGLFVDTCLRLFSAIRSKAVVRITPEFVRVDGPHGRKARVDRRHIRLDITEDADGAILWVSEQVPVRADIDPTILRERIAPLRPRTAHTTADVVALQAALGPLASTNDQPRSFLSALEPIRANALRASGGMALAALAFLLFLHLTLRGPLQLGALIGAGLWVAWSAWRVLLTRVDAQRRAAAPPIADVENTHQKAISEATEPNPERGRRTAPVQVVAPSSRSDQR